MNETQFLALIPNAICIGISIFLAVRIFRKSSLEHRKWMLATFAFISLLALVLGVERFIGDRSTFAVMVVLEYSTSVALLVSVLSFSLCYTGQGRIVSRRFIISILLLGAGIISLNATNGLHHQFYTSFVIVGTEGLHTLQPEYGPLFYIWLFYILGIMFFVMGLLLKAAGSMMGSKRTGTIFIVLGLGFYTFMGVMNSIIERDPRIDMLTIGLVGAALMVYAANLKSNLIEQHGMTMEEALRDMEDGVIIEDSEHRVMYMNDTARELTSAGRSTDMDSISSDGSRDVHLATMNGDREFNVNRSTVERNGVSVGTVTVLRDVTERKSFEKRLELANHRLDTMGRALRHDVMNELTVLNGHLELLTGTELTEKQRVRLEKALKAARRIDDLIEKTRMDHILDPVKPKWQGLEQSVRDGIRNAELEEVKLRVGLCDCEVLADPMLPTVFGNLIDNSLRHGGTVKEIGIRVERKDSGALIIWEDDGVGIPQDDKKRIFERGIGKHTGMGLFLVREILNITGMDIYEDGVPGKGARFIITVPGSSIREPEKK
jgi:signal transduction histidine kinase